MNKSKFYHNSDIKPEIDASFFLVFQFPIYISNYCTSIYLRSYRYLTIKYYIHIEIQNQFAVLFDIL